MVDVRSEIQSRIDPTYRWQVPAATAPSLIGPADLLGALPAKDVTELTEVARALAGADAASVDAYPPPPRPTGGLDIRV